jgi:hypothetical protein
LTRIRVGTAVSGDGSTTVAETVALQERLRSRVDPTSKGPDVVRTIAGLDVAYAEGSGLLPAAVAVLDALERIDSAVVSGRARPVGSRLFASRRIQRRRSYIVLDRILSGVDQLARAGVQARC